MTWVRRYHECAPPGSDPAIGSIWECDVCGRRWRAGLTGWRLTLRSVFRRRTPA